MLYNDLGDYMENNVNLQRKFHIEKHYVSDPLKLNNIFLLQIGRTHCTNETIIDAHIHRNWFELTLILEGRGYVVTNGVSVPIKAGEIYLSFPGDIHAIYTDKEKPLKYNFLSIWPDDEKLLDRFEEIMLYYSDPTKRVFADKDIEYLIGNSISEIFFDDEYSKDMLVFALNQIMRYVIRNFGGNKKNKKLNVGSSQELCYQMMNYISTHIYVMNGLSTLSDYFGYSYSYLSDVFHKTTGETLMQYYTLRRLDVSAMLIKENRLSIGEISELLKYSSIYTFSRAFKNHFGVSPTEYKKGERL